MMNLGEFRKLTIDLPDDTVIMIDEGDLQMAEARHGMTLPPVLDHPFLLTLKMGQIWNYEYDIDARIDAHHMGMGL